MTGTRTEARDLGREGIKEQNIENEEPRGAGIQDGSAISEEFGQCIWSDV